MRVREIELTSNSVEQRLSAQVDFESISRPTHDLWYSFPLDLSIDVRGDAFLAACLFPAMVIEERLEIEGPISPQLWSRIEQIQDIFVQWNKKAKRIPIEATIEAPARRKENRIGSFFTMGVDSFYTVLNESKNPNRSPDSLIYVHGFDVTLSNEKLYRQIVTNLERVAASMGKALILAKTSARPFGDIGLQWGEDYHGAALASVGLLLGQNFKTIYIPATRDYSELVRWGSHPLLDPLWSNEIITFCHHGAGYSRTGKIMTEISKSDIALNYLRVCFENIGDAYNCGHCEKCIRTMIALYVAGVLEDCETFNNSLTPKLISSLKYGEFAAFFAQENYHSLEDLPFSRENQKLINSLKKVIKKAKIKRFWKEFRDLMAK